MNKKFYRASESAKPVRVDFGIVGNRNQLASSTHTGFVE